MLIFEMKLFALQSCQPFGPLHRLPKKTSSVSGNHTGASCAKIAPGCVAIAPDGRLLPQDTQELRVIDLEERWVGVGRIEVFVERILAESTTLA